MEADKKYYWLKLKRDFFKRHDIRIVEAMPNGKDYVLFYLKLMVESVDHGGELRFSDTIPYNEEMLSVITNTNPDIVRAAMKIFVQLQLVDILDDQTIYMNEVNRMIGSAANNSNANRQQRFRDRKKELALTACYAGVTENNADRYEGVTENNESKSKSKSKSKEKEKEIYKEKEKEKSTPAARFTPPTIEQVSDYCAERANSIDPQRFVDFYTARGWMIGKNKMKDWKAAIRTWETRDKGATRNADTDKPNFAELYGIDI